jgi:hypothetical protein
VGGRGRSTEREGRRGRKRKCICIYFSVVGTESPTPENRTIQAVIRTLFTTYLTKCISRSTTNEVQLT